MIKTEDISKLYQGEDERVIEFLKSVIDGMGGSVEDYNKTMLDLLQAQLFMYYKAHDALHENFDMNTGGHNNVTTKMAVILQKSFSQIFKILQECGVTKMTSAKMQILNKGDNAAVIVGKLTE